MKQIFAMAMVAGAAFALASCHSSESAYKKAYEKAQAAQAAEQSYTQQYTNETQTTAVPVQQTTVTATTSNTAPVDYSNVTVRTEEVQLVNGDGLKPYSVIIGSFSMQSNANALQATMKQKGYNAQVVSAQVNGQTFYRVAASTFDTKQEAAASRAGLVSQFSDAWLLYKK